MGKVVVEKKRKKKKGRPSLLDLQKRSLKQQQNLHKQFLKKHNLKQTQNHKQTNKTSLQNPSPNSSSAGVRRSTRRNPNPNSDDEHSSGNKKREKKLELVLQSPDDDDDDDDDEDEVVEEEDDELNSGDERENSGDEEGRNLRKRKIDSISRGSGTDNDDKGEKLSAAATNQTNTQQGSNLDDASSTPLPDKKLLLFILDRLQKKDTYGVFAEPVDPEELPDYFEVIQHPMDFGTVRKKLETCAYANLESFETDVFLICSNAMQYNAPDTVYFRQARSIQELAKKNFDNLRQDSDDNEPEPEPKVVRRGRPPTKNLKRPLGRPPLERAASDFSEGTPAAVGGTTNRSTNELRKGPPHLENYGTTDSFARSFYSSRNSEAYIGWSADRYERAGDLTGSASKGISMKHGKKQVVLDENRRNTYNQSCAFACRQEPSVMSTFEGERKQLIAVGLHSEYGYARSLARFAAKVGPVAWKVASRKIQRCLPPGVKFGSGWVGENETPAERPLQQLPDASGQPSAPASVPVHGDSSATPKSLVDSSDDRSEQQPQGEKLSETHTACLQPKSDDEPDKVVTPVAGDDATSVSSAITSSNGADPNLIAPPEASASLSPSSMVNMLSSSTGSMRSGSSFQIHQVSTIQSRINGLNGSYGLNFAAQMGKMIGAARPSMLNFPSNPPIVAVSRAETQSICQSSADINGCGEAKLSANSITIKPGEGLPNAGPHQKVGSKPPDLNVGFQSPGSPGSGKADSVQPDLALQL